MKYLINAIDSIDEKIGRHLSEEISRFDIRSEIVTLHSKQRIEKNAFDAIIQIGGRDVPSRILKRGKMIFHLTQEYKGGLTRKQHGVNYFRPFQSSDRQEEFLGFVFFDMLKRTDLVDENENQETIISILSGFRPVKQNHQRLIAEIKKGFNSAIIKEINLNDNFSDGIVQAVKSNVVITADDVGAFIALYFNIPSLGIYRKGIFNRKTPKSYIDQILGRALIHKLPSTDRKGIIMELDRILHDHEYCATILDGYQELKNNIGLQPAIRNIARIIVESVED